MSSDGTVPVDPDDLVVALELAGTVPNRDGLDQAALNRLVEALRDGGDPLGARRARRAVGAPRAPRARRS